MYVTERWPTAEQMGMIEPYELCKQSGQAQWNQNPYAIKHWKIVYQTKWPIYFMHTLWIQESTWAVQKVSVIFFFTETNEGWEVCCGMEVEGTFMCLRGFFPASRQCQSHAASMWVRVYTQHASHCLFSAKIMEWLQQWYCIKFCQKLGDSEVETIQKI
jgi:hypothetical protein